MNQIDESRELEYFESISALNLFPFLKKMYVLIAWTTKNGVPLEKEALEVVLNTELTIMNGGKMEPGATVNMLFKREIWGGTIQSIHGMYCYWICTANSKWVSACD